MKIEIGSLPMVLFIIFLVLKLCNVITWSWWWVTAPLWITAGIILLIGLLVSIVNLIIYLIIYFKS